MHSQKVDTIEFNVRSKALNMIVSVVASKEGVEDIYFRDTRRSLPVKMFDKIIDNDHDDDQIQSWISNSILEGEL